MTQVKTFTAKKLTTLDGEINTFLKNRKIKLVQDIKYSNYIETKNNEEKRIFVATVICTI